MTRTNQELLAKLDAAFKTITVTDLDESILAPEKFDQFVRVMQLNTRILPEARFIEMDSQQVDIDRIGFVGRIMVAGEWRDNGEATRDHKVLDTAEYAKPQFHTNKLLAKELQSVVGLRDKALRRNIERGGFENTLIDLFGEASGRDLEEWALLADTEIVIAPGDIMELSDNWIKLAENKIYGGAGGQFDPEAADFPENMFQAMINALPKQYLQDRTAWRFYVDFETEDSYRNLLKARGTMLGDMAQTEDGDFAYKGIPVVYVPLLERAKPEPDGPGRVALFSHPDNMAWGIFHEVTIERERQAVARRTDFVLTVEADAHYEDENAAVAAYLDQDAPV